MYIQETSAAFCCLAQLFWKLLARLVHDLLAIVIVWCNLNLPRKENLIRVPQVCTMAARYTYMSNRTSHSGLISETIRMYSLVVRTSSW